MLCYPTICTATNMRIDPTAIKCWPLESTHNLVSDAIEPAD